MREKYLRNGFPALDKWKSLGAEDNFTGLINLNLRPYSSVMILSNVSP